MEAVVVNPNCEVHEVDLGLQWAKFPDELIDRAVDCRLEGCPFLCLCGCVRDSPNTKDVINETTIEGEVV